MVFAGAEDLVVVYWIRCVVHPAKQTNFNQVLIICYLITFYWVIIDLVILEFFNSFLISNTHSNSDTATATYYAQVKRPITGCRMYNYAYTPVTVKVVCNILYSKLHKKLLRIGVAILPLKLKFNHP